MNKNLITLLPLICILYFSCSKSKQPDPQNSSAGSVSIALVSGSGQTDTIGQMLPNNIVVKVTQNGSALSGYKVKFQGSGCNSDRIDSLLTGGDGTASDFWTLAGDIGQQTMKVYAVSSQNVKVDSVTATSTGLAPGGTGWHASACTIRGGFSISNICKLSTGELFACYNGIGLRYSTDNGMSWNLVTSLGNSHDLAFVVSSPSDELFAFSPGNGGIFYSSNAGATWTTLPAPSFGNLISVACTSSGTLMVTDDGTVFVSFDKGNTWTTPAIPLNPGDAIGSPAEDKSGNLYCVAQETETIYKSANNGNTWTAILNPNELDFSFYIDNNNNFYKDRTEPGTGGIYTSKDNGVTYTQLISSPNTFLGNMSVQSDGNFYYDYTGIGIYRTIGISSSPKNIFPDGQITTPYIVAKNGNVIIVGTDGEMRFLN